MIMGIDGLQGLVGRWWGIIMNSCLIIGISGPTTSGKTTLADILSDRLDCPVIHQDKYYYSSSIIKEKLNSNYELPQCIHHQLLYQDIVARSKQCPLLIVEGFQIYSFPQIVNLVNLKVFIQLSDGKIRERRMITNPCKQQYLNQKILPEAKRYRDKCKQIQGIQFIDGTVTPKEVLAQFMECYERYKVMASQ